MSYTPGLNDFDPEFEDPINLVPERSRTVLREVKRQNWEYQQILVNPFLLMVATTACQIVAALFWRSKPLNAIPVMVISVMACFFFTSRLFQCHCLDCGKTVPLKGWKNHACPGLLDRIRARKNRKLPIPSAGFQAAFYKWVVYPLAFVTLYFTVVRLGFSGLENR